MMMMMMMMMMMIMMMMMMMMMIVTQPIYESRMNWIIDPTPPASAVNTPPSEARPKLPGRSRRRRRRKKKATAAAQWQFSSSHG